MFLFCCCGYAVRRTKQTSTYLLTNNGNGKVAAYVDYDAWGAMDKKAVIKGSGREIDVVMSYTGHPYDQVLGLYFAQARMYDQGDRRFVAVDPIVGNGPMPQVLIQYVYVINNPVKYIDLDGLEVATVSVNGVSMTVDTSSSNSVLKMLKLFDIDVRKVSTQNIFTGTVDVQVYNYANKAATTFKFKKNMAITDILNYAGISAGSSGSAYFRMIWCEPAQSYKYTVMAQNKYEHYLGKTISSVETYLNNNAIFEDFLLVDNIYFMYGRYFLATPEPDEVFAAVYIVKTYDKETAITKLKELNYTSNMSLGRDYGTVGRIVEAYEMSRLGISCAEGQEQFDKVQNQERNMILAMYGGIIADALFNGRQCRHTTVAKVPWICLRKMVCSTKTSNRCSMANGIMEK